MLALQPFGKENYAMLIQWIDRAATLMQFGGPGFTFPLTTDQLDLSLRDPNRIAFCVVESNNGASIGHAEIYLSGGSSHLGRIIIAEESMRGKGWDNNLCTCCWTTHLTNCSRQLLS